MTDIFIHQLLHGYDDGHRGVAGSTILRSPRDDKRVLIMSDMSGPAWSSPVDSYVTGYPLAESGVYALARTWRADEMRRPGCVWTHTLLIGFSDLAALSAPGVLNRLFVRPDPLGRKGSDELRATYGRPLCVDPADVVALDLIDHGSISEVLRALYLSPRSPVVLPRSSMSNPDALLLAIWGEQWPRLRRNFRFCSLVSSDRSRDGEPFDLQLYEQSHWPIRGPTRDGGIKVESSLSERWLRVASEGILRLDEEGLTEFLRWAGSSAPGGRAAFAPLCEIFSFLYAHGSEDVDGAMDVVETFSKELDTMLLWPVLCEIALQLGGPRDFGRWPVFLSWLHLGQLESLSEDQIVRIAWRSWLFVSASEVGLLDDPARSRLTEILARLPPTLAENLTDEVIAAVVVRFPELSSHSYIHSLPDSRMESIIRFVVDLNPPSVAPLLESAVISVGHSLPDIFYRAVRASEVMHTVNRLFDRVINPDWFLKTAEFPNDLATFVGTVANPNIGFFAALASSSSPALVPNAVGDDPWLNVTYRFGQRNIPLVLACYLTSRALRGASNSSMALLTATFDGLHEAISASKLSAREWGILDSVLPQLDEYQSWDRSLRLRIGIAMHVVQREVEAAELLRLTHDQLVLSWIISAIRLVDGGKRYLKGVSKDIPKYAKGSSLLERLWRLVDD